MSTPFFPPERCPTDRVLLRCWRPGDGAALTEAVNASLDHLWPWMPWVSGPQDPVQSEANARRFRGLWLTGEDYVIGVWDPAEQRVLGGTGFHLRHGPIEGGVAEIGMWIRADAAGQGLGRHVLQTLVAWGFTAWPWRRLVWRCDVENHASRRVAEACGFTLEGIARQDQAAVRGGGLRDTATYALLKPRAVRAP